MKKFIMYLIGSLLFLSNQSIYAGECDNQRFVAMATMAARQGGASQSLAQKKLTSGVSATMKRFINGYLDMAYQEKVYSSEKEKKASMIQFGDLAYKACLLANM